MIIMKWTSIGLVVAAAVTGLVAARYWLQASRIPITPTWQIEPGETLEAETGWTAGMVQASSSSALLNAKAAGWTAVSVGLAAISGIISGISGILG